MRKNWLKCVGLLLHVLGSSWVMSKYLVFVPTYIIFPMIERVTSFLKTKVIELSNFEKREKYM